MQRALYILFAAFVAIAITLGYGIFGYTGYLLQLLQIEELSPVLWYGLLLVAILSLALGIMCFAQATSYRKPLHTLSHDAVMEALPEMVTHAMYLSMSGLFDSIPRYKRLEEICEMLMEEYPRLRQEVAMIVGKIAELHHDGMGDLDQGKLTTLERQLADGEALHTEWHRTLGETRERINKLSERAGALKTLNLQDAEEYALLHADIQKVQDYLAEIQPVASSNVLSLRTTLRTPE